MTTKTRKQLLAFAWAILGGASTASIEALRTPGIIDWQHVRKAAAVGALIGAVAYLQQPPRRTWSAEERRAAWDLEQAKKQLELAKDDPQSQASSNAPVPVPVPAPALVQAPTCFEEDGLPKP